MMAKILSHCNLETRDELFNYLASTFKNKITTWDYFVNWNKVHNKVAEIETELNILNVLIGKDDFESAAISVLKEYPQVIKAFPALIASRDTSYQILVDSSEFLYKNYNFGERELSTHDVDDLIFFLKSSGIAELLKNRRLKNLVDYVYGVEVGLDSNGRKNRGGELMEKIVQILIEKESKKIDFQWMRQATKNKLHNEWGISIKVDKSNRTIDFAILYKGRLIFIEVNFYGGGGSKLKSTAGEYQTMRKFWQSQNIEFIWVTDGFGWKSTLKPLREYFDDGGIVINLEMLNNGILTSILQPK